MASSEMDADAMATVTTAPPDICKVIELTASWRSLCRLHASGQASRRQLIQIENLERMVCDIADNANYDIVAARYNGILATLTRPRVRTLPEEVFN